MLSNLLIRDFAIIEYLEVELNLGMTALTGETGAGKSILIDAIGLVLGDRADSTVVRTGAEKAEISATFDLQGQHEALQWLSERDLDEGNESCTIRRIITRENRTRAYIGGSPVTLQVLKELGELLVDIHGQHAHQSLLHRKNQRTLLDLQAGHEPLLEELLAIYREWSVLQAAQDAADDIESRQKRLDLIDFQYHELEAAAPRPGEAAEIEEEHHRLAHTTQLLEAIQSAYNLIYEGDPDVNGMLSHAVDALEPVSGLDPKLIAPVEMLRSAQVEIQESALALRHYMDELPIDSTRLDELSNRLTMLQTLARKHRCQTDELPEKLNELEAERESLLKCDEERARREVEIHSLVERYIKLATRISQGRQKAAKALGEAVSEAMQILGMTGGRFEISVQVSRFENPTQHGIDTVEFQVSANPGQPLRPLAKVASGGELSRISLALQLAATRDLRLSTLIFDEVDSGIGGGIAEVVGRMLRQLGSDRQILCVTHLPQVAAQAHHQLGIRKIKGSEATETQIEQLSTESARIQEIARMLGGIHISPQTHAHAEEMLRSAQRE